MVYATEGVMTVNTEDGAWVIPAHRAAWVPAGTLHEVRTTGRVRMRTVYIRPDLTLELPPTCCVLSVSALLRELILETIRIGMLRDDVPEQQRLARVLVDRIRVTPQVPLEITWPTDGRARRIADTVKENLRSCAPLASLARGSGASVRTLERLFLAQTGTTFGRWRQQARLVQALRHLAAGDSVTMTARSVGFGSTSAFIAMFKRCLGKTPGSYFQSQ